MLLDGEERRRVDRRLVQVSLHGDEERRALVPPRKSGVDSGFEIHFAEPWLDVIPDATGVEVVTDKARYRFDAVVLATGFSIDLSRRPLSRDAEARVLD